MADGDRGLDVCRSIRGGNTATTRLDVGLVLTLSSLDKRRLPTLVKQHVESIASAAKMSRIGNLEAVSHLRPLLEMFIEDHPDPEKTVFLMMPFGGSEHLNQALDGKLWIELSADERKSLVDIRLEALRLREALPLDNPITRLEHELESEISKQQHLEERLEVVEAQATRLDGAVGRGWGLIAVLAFLSLAAAPDLDWSRASVIFVWGVIALVWLILWGRSKS